MFDAEFAHRKPSAAVRYADFVVSEMGVDDTVDGMTPPETGRNAL